MLSGRGNNPSPWLSVYGIVVELRTPGPCKILGCRAGGSPSSDFLLFAAFLPPLDPSLFVPLLKQYELLDEVVVPVSYWLVLKGLYLKDAADLGIVDEHSEGAVDGGVEEEFTNLADARTAVLGCKPLRKHLTLCLWPKTKRQTQRGLFLGHNKIIHMLVHKDIFLSKQCTC